MRKKLQRYATRSANYPLSPTRSNHGNAESQSGVVSKLSQFSDARCPRFANGDEWRNRYNSNQFGIRTERQRCRISVCGNQTEMKSALRCCRSNKWTQGRSSKSFVPELTTIKLSHKDESSVAKRLTTELRELWPPRPFGMRNPLHEILYAQQSISPAAGVKVAQQQRVHNSDKEFLLPCCSLRCIVEL